MPQREICRQIIEAEGDYCVALKKNQPTLHEDVATYFQDEGLGMMTFTHYDKGHGRIEKRVCRVFDEIDWLKKEHQ
jgi:predicted transposase YbfD/YdcC